MKNKYVVIGMIIIIAVVVVLAIFEIYSSISFNGKNEVIPAKHQDITYIIQVTKDEEYRNEQMNYAIKNNHIK